MTYRCKVPLIQRKEKVSECGKSQVLYGREILASTVKIDNLIYLGRWKHKVDPQSVVRQESVKAE